MDLKEIVRETTGINTRTTPENFIRRKINQFKDRIVFSIIFTIISLGIVLTVAIYLYIVISRAMK
jgi:hypothetical protein